VQPFDYYIKHDDTTSSNGTHWMVVGNFTCIQKFKYHVKYNGIHYTDLHISTKYKTTGT
jgi:hypothetical protein